MIILSIMYTLFTGSVAYAEQPTLAEITSAVKAACSPRSVVNASAPSILFHIGEKSNLFEDASANTIPPSVWDNFIMGNQTRFQLPPYRRGLYGGTDLASLEIYANGLLGTGAGTPWVMKVAIRPTCTSKEASTHFQTDGRYREWLTNNIDALENEAPECIQTRIANLACEDVVYVDPFARVEDKCAEIAGRFLRENAFKLVEDHLSPNSWYVRDRECIQSVTASPGEVVEYLSESRWDWDSRRMVYMYTGTGGFGLSTFAILVSALADQPNISNQSFQRLFQKLSSSDMRMTYSATPDNPEWLKKSGPELLNAFRRCSTSNQFPKFNSAANSFLDGLRSHIPEGVEEFSALVDGLALEMSHMCR